MSLIRQSLSFCVFAACVATQSAHASVTMLGNRVIYPEHTASVDVKLTNKDNLPYVMQCWFDSGDPKSTPQNGVAPFVVTPPMFRISPHSGQTARIVFTGDASKMPKDRESVYYFNFLQIPPSGSNANEAKKSNQLLLLLRNRVKVFYRPKQISNPVDQVSHINVSINKQANGAGYTVRLNNANPWFASVANVDIDQGQKHAKSKETDMISPFDHHDWSYANLQLNEKQPVNVTIRMVNDQGGIVSHQYSVSF